MAKQRSAGIGVAIDPRGSIDGQKVVVRALDQIRAAAKRSGQSFRDMERDQTTSLQNISRQISSASIILRGAFATAVGAVAVEAVKSAANFDAMSRGLTVVAGSSDLAAKEIAQLKEIAKLPGIGFQEAEQGAVRLQVVGESAAEALRQIKAFGNAIALTGGGAEELERVTVQLAQMASKSKVLAQDLRPIIEAAPAVAGAMKKAFGTVDSEQIQKLGITTHDFIARLTAELEQLPAAADSPKNAFENLTQAVQFAGASVTNEFLPQIADAARSATSFFEGISKNPEGVHEVFSDLATGAELAAIAIGGRLIGSMAELAVRRAIDLQDSTAAAGARVREIDAAIADAEAQRVEAESSREGAIAHLNMAKAIGTATVARQEMVAATAEIVAANKALAASDANIIGLQTARAAATAEASLAARAGATATGLLSGAVDLLGGPVGVVITAATAGWLLWEHHIRSTTSAVQEQRRSIADLAQGLSGMTKEMAKSVEEAAKLNLEALAVKRTQLENQKQLAELDLGGAAFQRDKQNANLPEGARFTGDTPAMEAARAKLTEVNRELAQNNTLTAQQKTMLDAATDALTRHAKATGDAGGKYHDLTVELKAQLDAEAQIAAAYRESTAAGQAAEERLKTEADLRAKTKTLTAAQTTAARTLAAAVKESADTTAFEKVMAGLRDQAAAQDSVRDAYQRSYLAGQEREEGLKTEAEYLKAAGDAGVGYAAQLYLSGDAEKAAAADINGRALALAKAIVAVQQHTAAAQAEKGVLEAEAATMERLLKAANAVVTNGRVQSLAPGESGLVRAPSLDFDRLKSGIDDGVHEAQAAADAMKSIYEEAARGIEQSLAGAFDGLLPHVDGVAGEIVSVFEGVTDQIAAAFASKELGIGKLLSELQKEGESVGQALEAAFGKIGSKAIGFGGGALIGGLAGFESGSVGTGVLSGAASGAAFGSVVPGVGTAAGAVLGAVGGLVGGLLGSADHAKEAAAKMKAAREAWEAQLDAFAEAANPTDLNKLLAGTGFDSRGALQAAIDKDQAEIDRLTARAGRLNENQQPIPRDLLGELDAVGADMRKLTEEAKKYDDALKAIEKATLDDLNVRALVAEGHKDEADALRLQIAQQKEYADAVKAGFSPDVLARIKEVQAEEKKAQEDAQKQAAAAAAAKQAEDRRSFTASLAELQATNAGDTIGALRAQITEQNAEQLDSARKLLDAGTITQQMFDDLSAALGVKLTNAVHDATEAINEAAAAAKKAATDFNDNLDLQFLGATQGQDAVDRKKAADDFNANMRQLQDEFNKGLINAVDFGRLRNEAVVVYQNAIAGIGAAGQAAADSAGSAAAAAAAHAASSETVKSVQAISETTAVRMTDILTGSNIWLSEIAFNTRALRGDGPSVFPGHGVGVAARPVAPAPPVVQASGGGVTVVLNNVQVFGTMTAQDIRRFAKELAPAIGQELGQQTKQYGRLGGSAGG